MTKKIPIWKLLVENNYFEDRKTASSWIMTGKVLCNNERINNIGELVDLDANIRIKGADLKYVGKGGVKLEKALSYFKIDVKDKVTLDTGASTGGFTDCLIQHQAARVYAIDVGYGQLAGKLRVNKKVVNMEKTNISDVKPESLVPKPSFASVDLSYLSLKKGIPIVANLLNSDGELLCLVKPLFEIEDSTVRREGVIKNPEMYRQVLEDLVTFVENMGIYCLGITNSTITGNKGTREFFIWLSLKQTADKRNIKEDILNSIYEVEKLEIYKKK
ncbi:MAG: TlyA family RNA methyltransferase [Niallia nealsonii]|nr:TlyA family RNA methyltransferase [Niallia nealsonii]